MLRYPVPNAIFHGASIPYGQLPSAHAHLFIRICTNTSPTGKFANTLLNLAYGPATLLNPACSSAPMKAPSESGPVCICCILVRLLSYRPTMLQLPDLQDLEGHDCCDLQVDDFELAEETPAKAPPPSRTPVTASPDPPEPQTRRAKPPASAERRTAEWLTALSPVMEHEEHSPVDHLGSRAAQVVEHDACSTVSQVDSAVAGASPAVEHDKRSPGTRPDARHADGSPDESGVHQLDKHIHGQKQWGWGVGRCLSLMGVCNHGVCTETVLSAQSVPLHISHCTMKLQAAVDLLILTCACLSPRPRCHQQPPTSATLIPAFTLPQGCTHTMPLLHS